jgi:hypothetical protein
MTRLIIPPQVTDVHFVITRDKNNASDLPPLFRLLADGVS